MKKIIRSYLRQFPFDEQIFVILMFFMAILSTLLIIENILIKYPFEANYKWFSVLALSLFVIVFSLKRQQFHMIKVIVFTSLVFILLPFGWISAGLNNSYTIAYSFLILICIAFFFTGKERLFFMIGELAVILTMVTLTIFTPGLFLVPDQDVMVVDFLVQVPLTYITAAVLLSALMNAYYKEQNRIMEYAALLDAKNKALMKLATEDDLTGIYNRRYVFEKLEEIRQMGFDDKLVIGMVDIVNLKTVNDVFGHAAGDRVITQIAQDLTKLTGSGGLVGRFGGDEFAIIIYPGSEVITEEIIQKVSDYNFPLDEFGSHVKIAGSFVKSRQTDDINRLLVHADKALLKAKKNGHSHVVEDLD